MQLRSVLGMILPRILAFGSCVFVGAAGVATAYAGDAEDIFKQAPAYTVQIRTAVDVPFFGDRKISSLGAGFVVDAARGWVMTNAHVAARSPSEIRIAFRGGEYREASKVYVDPYLDLAILQLSDQQREKLTAARLDCGDLPPVGYPVGAFGHPWGLAYTGTRGIISGVTSKMGGEMLQTDAPINAGNSGGPLISLDTGEIVGINTATIASEKDQNTNFALPIRYACRVLTLLEAGKDPSPPKLSMVFVKDLDDRGELTVAENYLSPDTIALQPGDIIKKVVGVSGEIHNEGQLVHALRGRLDHVGLGIIRAGKSMTLSGRLAPAGRIIDREGLFVSGVLLAPAGLRDDRELNVDQPLLVHYVERGSLGESLEIFPGDVLVKVNGQPVHGLADLQARVRAAADKNAPVALVFKRVSSERDQLFDYVERTLAIEGFRVVGGNRAERMAKK